MPDNNQIKRQSAEQKCQTGEIRDEIAHLSHVISNLADQVASLSAVSNDKSKLVDDIFGANTFVFDANPHSLHPVKSVSAPPLDLLFGIDRAKQTLFDNTLRFAKGYSANNALLWGARGMGKSTLIKSVHRNLLETTQAPALIEVHREDIASLPLLLRNLGTIDRRFILFCDDLSFNRPDQDFKALKSVLEGGLEGRPGNILFYATSNRRHLTPRYTSDQDTATGLHANETMDEVIALSDRFGLWLGFHACDQADYLNIVSAYIQYFKLKINDEWQLSALEWAKVRGNRSGRTAWQFVQYLAGALNQSITF